MKISGFTMVRNADKYYFPIRESILSILPIVDEFIAVALGNNDAQDKTRQLIESIGSDKIKIYDRIWHEADFLDGKIFAQETNFALSQCKGDWCFYLQADEVVHEKDLPKILRACEEGLAEKNIDGLLFKYYHFWGDYRHYLPFHGWYKNEIRIIRNHVDIFSYKDAQSFRKKPNTRLQVKAIDAYIYHYGWVRPPDLMQSKKKEQDSMHHGVEKIKQEYHLKSKEFNFGALGKIPIFPFSHPSVMENFMQKLNWQAQLNYTKKTVLNREKVTHERMKYRFISFLERVFNKGEDIIGYKNWHKIK